MRYSMIAFETRHLEVYLNEVRKILLDYGAPVDKLDEVKEILAPYTVPIALNNLLLACENQDKDQFLTYGAALRRSLIMILRQRDNRSGVLPEAEVGENISVMVETAEKMITQDLDTFLEKQWFPSLLENLQLYQGMLWPDNYKKMYCAWPLRNCNHCGYDYYKDKTVSLPYCPKCGYVRSLCSNTSSPDGRCALHSRGPKKAIVAEIVEERKVKTRTQMYANAVRDYSLAQAFQELSQLPDTLSTRPEINLLGARVVQLIEQMSGLDIDAMHKKLLLSVREMERLRNKQVMTTEDFLEIDFIIQDMIHQTGIMLDDKTAWREISSLADQLSRMVENERKAESRDKAVITLEESVRLQKDFGRAVFMGIAGVMPDLQQKFTNQVVERLIEECDNLPSDTTMLMKAAAYNISIDKTIDTRWIVEMLLKEVKKQSEKQIEEMKQLIR